jgi:pilus assembly protein FimV
MVGSPAPVSAASAPVAPELAMDLSMPDAAEPDFSPEGTLVMPGAMLPAEAQDDLDIDLGMPTAEASPPADDSLLDIELDMGQPSGAAEAVLESSAKEIDLDEPGADAVDTPDDMTFDMPTADVSPAEDMTDEAAMPSPNFDISAINLDLAVDDNAPLTDEVSLSLDEGLDGELPSSDAPVAGESIEDDPMREEIKTKLDLAKAYEEMGDLEGARELLNEVLAEGPVDLAGVAREALDRIG